MTTLTSLPRELRDTIYTFALIVQGEITRDHCKWLIPPSPPSQNGAQSSPQTIALSLLQVAKPTSSESSQIFFSRNTFRLPPCLLDPSDNRTRAFMTHADLYRHITITFSLDDRIPIADNDGWGWLTQSRGSVLHHFWQVVGNRMALVMQMPRLRHVEVHCHPLGMARGLAGMRYGRLERCLGELPPVEDGMRCRKLTLLLGCGPGDGRAECAGEYRVAKSIAWEGFEVDFKASVCCWWEARAG